MRVLMVGTGDKPSSFIARQIEGLEKLGVHVDRLPEPRKHKVAVSRILQQGFLFPLGRDALTLAKRADVIHFQWPGYLYRYGTLADKLDKPAVLSLRGRQVNILPFLPDNEDYVDRLRSALTRADAFHCVSQAIMEEGRRFGVDPERSTVIRPAVDTSFFQPRSDRAESETTTIVMIGALIWRKAYEHALVALSKVKTRSDWRVQIVGSGEGEDHVRYTIDDLGLAARVELLGQRSPEEVRDILRSADVLLHSSVSEGIANVAIEAMACGVPAVVADSGGMAEAIEDGVQGRVLPLRDADAMAAALDELIADPERRRSMGAAGRDRAVREFDLTDQARAFKALYEEVAR